MIEIIDPNEPESSKFERDSRTIKLCYKLIENPNSTSADKNQCRKIIQELTGHHFGKQNKN